MSRSGAVRVRGEVNFYAYGTLKYDAEVASGDIEADGYGEILTGAGPGACSERGRARAYTWTGTALQDLPEFDQDVFPSLGYGATCAIGNVGI